MHFAGLFRKKLFPPGQLFPIHEGLKRKRGVGERHKSSRLGAFLHFRPLHPRISLHPNPSLALQASHTLRRAEELAKHQVKLQRRFDRIAWVAIFLLCGGNAASQTDVDGAKFFEQKIRPVLVERCYKCHSTGAKKVQAGLLLDTRQAVRAGGKRGPAVVPGNLGDSLLIEAIRHESLQMPPDGKLPGSVIADFVRWVEIGTPDPRDGAATPRSVDVDAGQLFWSFLPLGNYEPPEVPEAEWALTPIDRFILARQQAAGVEPSPIADRRTLLRRARTLG